MCQDCEQSLQYSMCQIEKESPSSQTSSQSSSEKAWPMCALSWASVMVIKMLASSVAAREIIHRRYVANFILYR